MNYNNIMTATGWVVWVIIWLVIGYALLNDAWRIAGKLKRRTYAWQWYEYKKFVKRVRSYKKPLVSYTSIISVLRGKRYQKHIFLHKMYEAIYIHQSVYNQLKSLINE